MIMHHVSSCGVGLVADPTPEHDSLSLYLEEIGRIQLLSKEQEREMISRVRAGDECAKRQFIEANLRLVVYVAKRYSEYCTASVSLQDLISVGNLGLIKAVERYDPLRGTFSNHAVYWIRQAISRTLIDQGRTIRVPVYIHTLLARLARLSATLFEAQGYEPTASQLAEAMNLSVEQVQFLTGVDELPVSLDHHISAHDERTTLADVIPDTSSPTPLEMLLAHAHANELPRQIACALACLTSREQQAIILRFGLFGKGEHTLREVGEQMGISRERVRQLQESALLKLQHAVFVEPSY